MKILITEEQFKKLVLKEQSDSKANKDKCIPLLPTTWNTVNYTLKDILHGGKLLHYGDEDSNGLHALKLIQRRLNTLQGTHFKEDGKYGPNILKRLSEFLNIDLCKQKNNVIPIGPNTLKKLGLSFEINEENRENYLLTSTLIGENVKGSDEEIFAILSTIKNRILHCSNLKNMEDVLSIYGQYSTLNHYNRLNDKEKKDELFDRVSNQKSKHDFERILKLVERFKITKPLPYNHYVANYLIKDYPNKTDSLATSYNENKKSAKEIGEHTFWWDAKHRCK